MLVEAIPANDAAVLAALGLQPGAARQDATSRRRWHQLGHRVVARTVEDETTRLAAGATRPGTLDRRIRVAYGLHAVAADALGSGSGSTDAAASAVRLVRVAQREAGDERLVGPDRVGRLDALVVLHQPKQLALHDDHVVALEADPRLAEAEEQRVRL